MEGFLEKGRNELEGGGVYKAIDLLQKATAELTTFPDTVDLGEAGGKETARIVV